MGRKRYNKAKKNKKQTANTNQPTSPTSPLARAPTFESKLIASINKLSFDNNFKSSASSSQSHLSHFECTSGQNLLLVAEEVFQNQQQPADDGSLDDAEAVCSSQVEDFVYVGDIKKIEPIPEEFDGLSLGFAVLPEQLFKYPPDFDNSVSQTCQLLSNAGFRYVTYPIGGMNRASYTFPEMPTSPCQIIIPPIALPDVQLKRFLWETYITGMISPFIDTDNVNPLIAKASQHALECELRYAHYLGLKTVFLPVKRIKSVNFYRIINYFLVVESLNINFCLLYPLTTNSFLDQPDAFFTDIYTLWVKFRRSIPCYNATRLSVGFYIQDTFIDNEFLGEDGLSRWRGEIIEAFLFGFETVVFTDAPPLREDSQLRGYFDDHMNFIATLATTPETQKFFYAPKGHTFPKQRLDVHYLVLSILTEKLNSIMQDTNNHHWKSDAIQTPMETIWKNLTSTVYESMEEDHLKYNLYGEALFRVYSKIEQSGKVNIYILGAGRGGLVSACHAALKRLHVCSDAVAIHAIEKNPGAVLALQFKKNSKRDWTNVNIIQGDLRVVLKNPFLPKANIVISEMIGAFGDNELCPELWSFVVPILAPYTISIPVKFQSWIAPVSCTSTNLQIANAVDLPRISICKTNPNTQQAINMSSTNWSDQIFVAPMRRCYEVGYPSRLFSFQFPILGEVPSPLNVSFQKPFFIPVPVEISGFVGYFSMTLCENADGQDDLVISNTQQFGVDKRHHVCKSWYSAFIPLRGRGIFVQGGTSLMLTFERISVENGVWYEWSVEYMDVYTNQRLKTSVQNQDGASHFMPLLPPRGDLNWMIE